MLLMEGKAHAYVFPSPGENPHCENLHRIWFYHYKNCKWWNVQALKTPYFLFVFLLDFQDTDLNRIHELLWCLIKNVRSSGIGLMLDVKNNSSGCKKWDTCAPEAILHAMVKRPCWKWWLYVLLFGDSISDINIISRRPALEQETRWSKIIEQTNKQIKNPINKQTNFIGE